ncbi:PREDICTED: VAN3-binding protein [Ipomoea nil]|uniref:VAN3-binding protein n=1 Tax=Ipomoea nil TaxID=35883 RepID=UPI0009017C2B|nr:PREDICTED: VAN3-binding protein [Ipomoea nil]
MDSRWKERSLDAGLLQLPESPRQPMEFLSRSWSASALQLCKALAAPKPAATIATSLAAQPPESAAAAAEDEEPAKLLGSAFPFASSATSQLVLERIMSQSMHNGQEISPLTSGRLSHSSGPLNGSLTEETDSPPVSPSEEMEDVVKYLQANSTLQPLFTNMRGGYGGGGGGSSGSGGAGTPAGGKTVGRWLKERREKKKEESRAQNAQLHAVVSVAGVAASVAAIAAATAAASSSNGKDENTAKADMAVASAAMLVAAQCVETAEAMGADRDHLMSAISSAVNVRSHGDISTLTAAAATALRGAATLKARALKEVWNMATVIPTDEVAAGAGRGKGGRGNNNSNSHGNGYCEGLDIEENFLGVCNQELLARGRELLKRTRNGDLHWKIVSVYIHRSGEVVLKMKSKHVANTITKKKKNVVLEVCKDIAAWPGRHLFEGGEQFRYFGLKTQVRGLIEFECRNHKEYEMWTQGVSRLLSIVAEKKLRRFHN